MYLHTLSLHTFRNYTQLDLKPSAGINILVGENAQGKTNLLEAIYLLATSRSLRTSRDAEMIQCAAQSAEVTAEIVRERDGALELALSIFSTEKKCLRINGIRRQKTVEILGQFNAVFFGASELSIISGEPAIRRRYLNMEISQLSPKYCYDLVAYKKVLDQRNKLLRERRDHPYLRCDVLEAWSEQLVRYGVPLLLKRQIFVERLAPLANEIHQELTEGRESLEVRLVPSMPLPDEASESAYEKSFRARLQEVASEEVRRGVTLLGPQRDDLQFLINGVDARSFGSQGQQRTVILSLKLAEYKLMEEDIGEPPVVLLDDVMSDLDDIRRRHLMNWLHRRCQVFLTCTQPQAVPTDILKESTLFRVHSGAIWRDRNENFSALGEEYRVAG
jgi:DNA replication and repair protein RecF